LTTDTFTAREQADIDLQHFLFSHLNVGEEKSAATRIEKESIEDSIRVTRDRCYDFRNIFAKKISEKNGVFDSKQSQILK
jgi:hypothetical protein